MLSVIARLSVKEEQLDEFRSLMTTLMADVAKDEPGCLVYQLCATKDPLEFVMVERYVDEKALGAHTKTAHFTKASPALGTCLSAPLRIELLKELQ